MKRKLLSLLTALVFLLSFFSVVGSPVMAGAYSVIVAGVNLASGSPSTVSGVSFAAATESTPATLTLDNATFAGTVYNEAGDVAGIQISGYANFDIVIAGTNSITTGGPGSRGIIMQQGNLTIRGAGSVTITGDNGVWMDGGGVARTLTFGGTLTANISSLRLEPTFTSPRTTAVFTPDVR